MKSLMDKAYVEGQISFQNKNAWTDAFLFVGNIESLSMQDLVKEPFLRIGGENDLFWLVPYVIRKTPSNISPIY
jgi:hypothetical protein